MARATESRLRVDKPALFRYLEYEHHHAAFVMLAILLMAGSSLLSGTWLRRLP